jgi:hypothetical protein
MSLSSVHLTRLILIAALVCLPALLGSAGTALARQSKEEQATVLRAVAMKYFDSMDVRKVGVLTRSEISRALKKKLIDPDDVEMIKWMRDHMDDVGHVIRVDTYSYATTAGPTVLSVPMPRAVYGISKEDLLNYGVSKEQLKEKKKEEKENHGQV